MIHVLLATSSTAGEIVEASLDTKTRSWMACSPSMGPGKGDARLSFFFKSFCRATFGPFLSGGSHTESACVNITALRLLEPLDLSAPLDAQKERGG